MSYVLGTVPQWITKSFPVLESVCLVILAILALALVVLVFMQINALKLSNKLKVQTLK